MEDQPHPVLFQLRCHRCACNDPSRNALINGGRPLPARPTMNYDARRRCRGARAYKALPV